MAVPGILHQASPSHRDREAEALPFPMVIVKELLSSPWKKRSPDTLKGQRDLYF